MSTAVVNNRSARVSGQDTFRLRMEEQCQQIRRYRQAMLRERGHLMSVDEAALEWIERFAATFDQSCEPGVPVPVTCA